MKKIQANLLLILSLIVCLSCEKDDICVDGNTPLLVIEFYDFDTLGEDEETLKAVPSLRIGGDGHEFTVNTIADRTSLDMVELPLKADATATTFHFIVNSATENNVEIGNTDIITFNYNAKEVFVSRACGFVMNYNNLTEELQVDADNWIKNITISETLIETQAITHVKIFH